MDFDVRLVATNSMSTVAPKYLLCVWTGVTSGSSCKASSFFLPQRMQGAGVSVLQGLSEPLDVGLGGRLVRWVVLTWRPAVEGGSSETS